MMGDNDINLFCSYDLVFWEKKANLWEKHKTALL